jgi:hypothetical protein
MFKFQYTLTYQGNIFEFVGHTGLRSSVLKNSIQIALFKKDSWKNLFNITADDDSDILIITAIIIAYNFHFKKSSNFVHDRGKFGWKLPPFDEDWKPNKH